MILSLVAVTVLALLALTVFQISRALVRESIYQLRLTQAQAIAEAGLEDALYRLRANYSWRAGFVQKSFAGGSYTVRLSTDSAPWVVSTGYSKPIFLLGPATRSVKAHARFAWSEAQNTAIAANRILLQEASLVDAYASGSDRQTASLPRANLWANANLEIRKGAGVWGNAYYAGAAAVAAGAVQGTVSKSTYTRTLTSNPYAGQNDNAAIPPCESAPQQDKRDAYDTNSRDLNVDANGCVVSLRRGIYFLHDINIASGTIKAQTQEGTVTLYLDGNLRLGQYGQLANADRLPSRLQIYARGGFIELNSSRPLYADIQAPSSRCIIGPQQVLYGRILCNEVIQLGTLHFDLELGMGEPVHVDWEPGSWSLGYQRAK